MPRPDSLQAGEPGRGFCSLPASLLPLAGLRKTDTMMPSLTGRSAHPARTRLEACCGGHTGEADVHGAG